MQIQALLCEVSIASQAVDQAFNTGSSGGDAGDSFLFLRIGKEEQLRVQEERSNFLSSETILILRLPRDRAVLRIIWEGDIN